MAEGSSENLRFLFLFFPLAADGLCLQGHIEHEHEHGTFEFEFQEVPVTPQNVIIAAKCNTNAKCNNNRRKM